MVYGPLVSKPYYSGLLPVQNHKINQHHVVFKEEEADIIKAIRKSETGSSGEIRVYVEDTCPRPNVVERAAEVFFDFEMQKTANRNGVLIYIAEKSRLFAVWGDSGIHEKVGFQFWDDEKSLLLDHFKDGKACEGVCKAVIQIGDKLRAHFPATDSDNENELPDELIYG
ncbi:MAG: TPM domain-containing protein [Saprospiraceae bacterium]